MSDATRSASGGVPLLRIWLSILGIFLLLSSFAFLAFPDEQVERLLAFSRSQENQRPCPLLCSKDAAKPVFGRWRPFWCPSRCGGEVEDVSLATHLMKALGATYGTLALLAFVLALSAAPLLRVVGAQCFAAWSLAQLATSSTSLLSPTDAANRVAFHAALVVANTLCSAWAVVRDC